MKAQLKYRLLQKQCSLIHSSLHISIPPSLLPFPLSLLPSFSLSFILSFLPSGVDTEVLLFLWRGHVRNHKSADVAPASAWAWAGGRVPLGPHSEGVVDASIANGVLGSWSTPLPSYFTLK